MGLTIIPTGLGVAEARYVNVAGDTMSGNLSLGGNILLDVGKLSMVGDIELGANKLKTTNLLIKEVDSNTMGVRTLDDTAYRDLATDRLEPAAIEFRISGKYIATPNSDAAYIGGYARKTGVGLVEIFRMVGAADPYFQMGPGAGALRVYNSGKIEALSDVDFGGNYLKNAVVAAEDPFTIGAHAFKDSEIGYLDLRNSTLTAFSHLRAGIGVFLSEVDDAGHLSFIVDGKGIRAANVDGYHSPFQARDTGVGLVEVARLQGAADPYFQATLPMVLKPSSAPGTPVEGHFYYDSVAKKLKFYNGTTWETVTSA